MTLALAVRMLPPLLVLCGCSQSHDAAMWECQLAVQKDNAGKSAAAAAERARDIEACMKDRGYLPDSTRQACTPGSTDASCYRRAQ
jgi:hypothetical protein